MAQYRFPQYAGFYIANMPYIYLILVGLSLAFPEIGHEAGPNYDPDVYLEDNALIFSNALWPKGGIEIPEIMHKIAKCESGDRHFDANGKVLVGKYNRYDLGRYQINRLYWEEKSKELGYDIFTEAGNEAMALYLYRKYGTSPWKRSEWCWSKG